MARRKAGNARPEEPGVHRYTFSLVTQGKHRFFSLTLPSDILASTCFVTTREDDPNLGFQRVLDRRRAEDIASYIDQGFGSIPNSIVLSAQQEAELRVTNRGRSLQFQGHPKAFLVLDGQHRVYGFKLARSHLRVPVVIYNELTRADETRLFIDINTKQRPVPNALLLDIKSLAEIEADDERLLREVFDSFAEDTSSALLGRMSAAKSATGRISRVAFNAAVKPALSVFPTKTGEEVYSVLNAYLGAWTSAAREQGLNESALVSPVVFKAVVAFFRDVARRVKDRHGQNYTSDNFYEVLLPAMSRVKSDQLKRPGRSPSQLHKHFQNALEQGFTL